MLFAFISLNQKKRLNCDDHIGIIRHVIIYFIYLIAVLEVNYYLRLTIFFLPDSVAVKVGFCKQFAFSPRKLCPLSAEAYTIIFYGGRGVWGQILSVFVEMHVFYQMAKKT